MVRQTYFFKSLTWLFKSKLFLKAPHILLHGYRFAHISMQACQWIQCSTIVDLPDFCLDSSTETCFILRCGYRGGPSYNILCIFMASSYTPKWRWGYSWLWFPDHNPVRGVPAKHCTGSLKASSSKFTKSIWNIFMNDYLGSKYIFYLIFNQIEYEANHNDS